MNLQRLAELINEKWPEPAVLFGSGLILRPNCETFHLSDTDSQNAKFIIWCLERLEELWRNHWAEQVSNLRHGIDLIGAVAGDEEYCVHVVVYPESDNWTPTAMYPPGKTRAEACALALMQALQGE